MLGREGGREGVEGGGREWRGEGGREGGSGRKGGREPHFFLSHFVSAPKCCDLVLRAS